MLKTYGSINIHCSAPTVIHSHLFLESSSAKVFLKVVRIIKPTYSTNAIVSSIIRLF